MTPLEQALADGEDVTDTPLGRALRAGGEKVTHESKHPIPARLSRDPARKGQPESVQEENERLGEDTGPAKTLRVPGVGGIVEGEPAPVGTATMQRWLDETIGGVQRVENAAGAAAVGGVLGGAAKGALAAKNLPATGRAAAIIEQAIENSFAHGGTFGTVAKLFPGATSAVVNATTKAAPAVVGGAVKGGAALGAAIAPQAAYQGREAIGNAAGGGTMTNAIDRLRASAAGNPRAAELMAKIDAQSRGSALPQSPQFPEGAGTGEVTQTTLGANP